VIVDLDDEAGLDPGRVGPKSAWLARARRAGLPVLPGFAVDASASRHHLAIGAETLLSRGSGGARLAVSGEPLHEADEVIEAGKELGPLLVARTSSTLEDRAEWSGAFTSYLDLTPAELPTGVVGCWASAFSVEALERQAAAGVEPGSFPMAVLVQAALQPRAGGTASIDAGSRVDIHGIEGHPAPLLGGWSGGEHAELVDGAWQDDGLKELVGEEALSELATALRIASEEIGATSCEWAFDDRMWILQLGREAERAAPVDSDDVGFEVDSDMVSEVRAMVLADVERSGTATDRYGRRPWEPLAAAVTLAVGERSRGTPAAPGVGAGIAVRISGREDRFTPRAVVVADRPVPFLAPLLWDAAGLVTRLGSPAAHLFRSARALGVPAVCGVELDARHDSIVAVDGDAGVVSKIALVDE
jgi:phosphoenolpyruvate synthase/pyruvate phosphate dikinase